MQTSIALIVENLIFSPLIFGIFFLITCCLPFWRKPRRKKHSSNLDDRALVGIIFFQ